MYILQPLCVLMESLKNINGIKNIKIKENKYSIIMVLDNTILIIRKIKNLVSL